MLAEISVDGDSGELLISQENMNTCNALFSMRTRADLSIDVFNVQSKQLTKTDASHDLRLV